MGLGRGMGSRGERVRVVDKVDEADKLSCCFSWVLGLRSWGLHVYDVVSILISLVFLFLLCVHHCINYNINYAKCHIYSAQAWSLEAMSHVYSWTALETF